MPKYNPSVLRGKPVQAPGVSALKRAVASVPELGHLLIGDLWWLNFVANCAICGKLQSTCPKATEATIVAYFRELLLTWQVERPRLREYRFD